MRLENLPGPGSTLPGKPLPPCSCLGLCPQPRPPSPEPPVLFVLRDRGQVQTRAGEGACKAPGSGVTCPRQNRPLDALWCFDLCSRGASLSQDCDAAL